MSELIHTKKNCTANDLCLGGVDGLFCGNCSAGVRTEENKSYEKEVKLQTAYEIIGRLDDGLQTVWIEKAIERLEKLKYIRENVPF